MSWDRMICVVLDAKHFQPNMITFGQFKSDTSSENHMTIVQMFAALCENMYLGYENNATRSRPEDEKAFIKQHNLPQFIMDDGETVVDKWRIFMERIPHADNDDVTLAWRIFIEFVDPQYSIGRAIQNLISLNNTELEAYRKTNPKFRNNNQYSARHDRWRRMHTTNSFVSCVVSTYLRNRTMADLEDDLATLNSSGTIPDCGHIYTPLVLFSISTAFGSHRVEGAPDDVNDHSNYSPQNSMHNNRMTFPRPDNVWQIRSYAFKPAVMDRLRLLHITTKEYGIMSVEDRRDREQRLIMATSIIDTIENSFGLTNNIQILAKKNEQIINTIEKSDFSDEERKAKWKAFLRYGWDEFAGVWSGNTDLSRPLMTMVSWYNKNVYDAERINRVFSPFMQISPIDSTMSVFGNMVVDIMTKLDLVSRVTTTHKQFLMCFVASMDCYRHDYGIKFNIIMAGPGASSKSFIMNLLEKLSIMDTISSITHETSKSRAGDEDQLDEVSLYDEYPIRITGHDKNSGETGDAIVKSSATSGRIASHVYVSDEKTGKRSFRVAYADVMRTIIGGTNEHPGKIPAALASRFEIVMMSATGDTDRSIMESMNASQLSVNREAKDAFVKQMCLYRYFVAMTFKLIQCQLLPPVDTSVAMDTFSRGLRGLQQRGIVMDSPRFIERMIIFARVLTVMNAIHTLILGTTACSNANTPFNISMMKGMAPLLVCSEEIAIFVFTFFADTIVNPIETEVLMSLVGMINDSRGNKDDDSGDGRFAVVSCIDDDGFEIDYDYYQWSYPSSRVVSTQPPAHALKQFINDVLGKRMSVENIDSVLMGLRERTIECRSFTEPDAYSHTDSDLSNDVGGSSSESSTGNSRSLLTIAKSIAGPSTTNIPAPSEGRSTMKPIIVIDSRRSVLKVLREAVRVASIGILQSSETHSSSVHPVEEQVLSMTHLHTRERKILTGCIVNEGFTVTPHVFKAVQLRRGRSVLKYPNPNYLTPSERRVLGSSDDDPITTSPSITIDDDVDRIKWEAFVEKYIRMMPEECDFNTYLPETIDVQQSAGLWTNYPVEYLNEIRAMISNKRKLQKQEASNKRRVLQ